MKLLKIQIKLSQSRGRISEIYVFKYLDKVLKISFLLFAFGTKEPFGYERNYFGGGFFGPTTLRDLLPGCIQILTFMLRCSIWNCLNIFYLSLSTLLKTNLFIFLKMYSLYKDVYTIRTKDNKTWENTCFRWYKIM